MFSKKWAFKWRIAFLICAIVGLEFLLDGDIGHNDSDFRHGIAILVCAAALAIVWIISELRKGVT